MVQFMVVGADDHRNCERADPGKHLPTLFRGAALEVKELRVTEELHPIEGEQLCKTCKCQLRTVQALIGDVIVQPYVVGE